jgi:hypothetical protein
MVSFKRSSSLKGNKNAAGKRKGGGLPSGKGGATAGTIGGLFGPVGSFAGGYIAGTNARATFGTANQAMGERQTRRARRASAIVGGTTLGIHAGMVGAAAGMAMKGGNVGAKVAGMQGALVGAAIGGTVGASLNYGASRLGARVAGSPKSNYNKKKDVSRDLKALQSHMKAGKPLFATKMTKLY